MFARQAVVFGLVTLLGLAASTAVCQVTPLNDLGAGLYLDQFQGGLYPGGSNVMPTAHAATGLTRAAAIRPLDTLGQIDPLGNVAMVSIGMSNTSQEFCGSNPPAGGCQPWSFVGQAEAHPSVNHSELAIVNGAAGGQSTATWDSPIDANYDRVRDNVLTPNGLGEQQVQVAWVKLATGSPTTSLPAAGAEAFQELQLMGDVMRALKVRYPNLQQVYLASRIYAGYATTPLHPEPYAYESAFTAKWLIEAQINQMNSGIIDPLVGDLNYETGAAPWLAWGPYTWADGLNPRSDELIWEQSDFSPTDGTHPSQSGQEKVGTMLLDFMLTSPHTQPWFLSPTAGDYDTDGDVDGADFLKWQRGELSDPPSAADLAVWETNFGNNTPLTATAVPEPATGIMLLLGVAGCSIAAGRLSQNPMPSRTLSWVARHMNDLTGVSF